MGQTLKRGRGQYKDSDLHSNLWSEMLSWYSSDDERTQTEREDIFIILSVAKMSGQYWKVLRLMLN